MIEINLLPESEQKTRSSRRAAPKKVESGGDRHSIPVIAFALVTFSVLGFMGFNSWSMVHREKVKFEELKAEKEAVDKQTAELSDEAKEIQELRKRFTNQLEVLQALDPPDRVLWSEKINMLADLMPPNIFLTEIAVKEHFREVEIQASIDAAAAWENGGRKGPKPETVKKPVITYTMRLQGLSTGVDGVEQFDNVLRFHDAIKSYESVNAWGSSSRFMDNFNADITVESIETTLYDDTYPVNEFIFVLNTRPMTSREPGQEPETTNTASTSGGSKPSA